MKKPPFQRLWLVWDERRRDYVHKASGTTLAELESAARQNGWRWHLSYPEGRKSRWCWFEVTKLNPSLQRLRSR